MTTAIRQQAGLDQFGAFLREQRHRLLRANWESRRRMDHWWTDPHKLKVVLLDLNDRFGAEECCRIMGEVLSKPWNWRDAYVCAECRRSDENRKGRKSC